MQDLGIHYTVQVLHGTAPEVTLTYATWKVKHIVDTINS